MTWLFQRQRKKWWQHKLKHDCINLEIRTWYPWYSWGVNFYSILRNFSFLLAFLQVISLYLWPLNINKRLWRGAWGYLYLTNQSIPVDLLSVSNSMWTFLRAFTRASLRVLTDVARDGFTTVQNVVFSSRLCWLAPIFQSWRGRSESV